MILMTNTLGENSFEIGYQQKNDICSINSLRNWRLPHRPNLLGEIGILFK